MENMLGPADRPVLEGGKQNGFFTVFGGIGAVCGFQLVHYMGTGGWFGAVFRQGLQTGVSSGQCVENGLVGNDEDPNGYLDVSFHIHSFSLLKNLKCDRNALAAALVVHHVHRECVGSLEREQRRLRSGEVEINLGLAGKSRSVREWND